MNCGLLPILQPEIAGREALCRLGSSQPPAPAAELGSGDPQPLEQLPDRQSCLAGPAKDELERPRHGRLGEPRIPSEFPKLFFLV